jgi:hypothetical protein
MSQEKDIQQSEQLLDDVKLDDKVEVSEDTLDEAQAPTVKGDAKSAKFGQGTDFEDDKEKNLATTSQAPVPKTKSGIISAAVDKLSGMKKEDLQVIYSKLFNEEVAEEVAETEVETVISEEQVQEDLKALVESEANLSEEFKEKTATLFNVAVSARLSEEKVKLEEKYISDLAEEVEGIRSELVEKIDGYLNYVVEQWMEQNELAVEQGLRTEIAESFMTQLQQVFVEHYIEVPEGKEDLIDDLASKVDELEEQLTSATDKSVKLAEEVETLRRAEIIREASEGLAATEAERLKSLVESIDAEDAEDFSKKVAIVKEAHFKKESTVTESQDQHEDTSLTEETTTSPRMAAYLSAISRTVK